MMNPNFYNRLIRPIVASSSAMQDYRILRQYHNNPLPKPRMVDTRPLSIISPINIIKPVCERTPLVPSSSKLSTYQILGPGIILLEDYISIKDQVDIVNICQKWGMGSGGFYTTRELERYMMCFGRNWDPVRLLRASDLHLCRFST
ncbi:unnamed protein product [Cuscuta campestris]|uniref:Uncharacterized protein n=1 Tax=Cuscuta campestris TaxID=132261 RepID=A0A484NP96_9ASTE|nr:unnamed protein product [Cuscuta campestris]